MSVTFHIFFLSQKPSTMSTTSSSGTSLQPMVVTSENTIVTASPNLPLPNPRHANASDLSQTPSSNATIDEVSNQPIIGTSPQSLSSTIHVAPKFQPKSLQVVLPIPPLNLHPMQTR